MVTHGCFVCYSLSKLYSIQIFKNDNKNALPKLLKNVSSINNEYSYYTVMNYNAMTVGRGGGGREGNVVAVIV